jgi:hypothetical protein
MAARPCLTRSEASYEDVIAELLKAGTVGAMVVSDVRERVDQSRPGTGPAFDLLASKLRRPWSRLGTVRRSSLIEGLVREGSRPIVSMVAPAGYGKTTLLSQ